MKRQKEGLNSQIFKSNFTKDTSWADIAKQIDNYLNPEIFISNFKGAKGGKEEADTKVFADAMSQFSSKLKKEGIDLPEESIEKLKRFFKDFEAEFFFGLRVMMQSTSDDSKKGCPDLIKLALSEKNFEAFKKGMQILNPAIKDDLNYKVLVTINDHLYKRIDNKFGYKCEKSTREFVINASRESLISICEHYIDGLEKVLKKAPKQMSPVEKTMREIESTRNYNLCSKASVGLENMSQEALADTSRKFIGIVEELQFFEEKKKGAQKGGQKR